MANGNSLFVKFESEFRAARRHYGEQPLKVRVSMRAYDQLEATDGWHKQCNGSKSRVFGVRIILDADVKQLWFFELDVAGVV